jgi:hypothetical protein
MVVIVIFEAQPIKTDEGRRGAVAGAYDFDEEADNGFTLAHAW